MMETLRPVGRCIYFGSKRYSADALTLAEEHIIPAGLGGQEILPEASCSDCEKVTGQWEQKWLRGNLEVLRQRLKLQNQRRQRGREKEGRTTANIFHPIRGDKTPVLLDE